VNLVQEKTELMMKEGHDDFDEDRLVWVCTYKFDNDSIVIGQYSGQAERGEDEGSRSKEQWQKWINNGEPIA